MTPQEFKKIWVNGGDSVSPIIADRLIALNLKNETVDFLTHSGLPEEAAPFLTFAKDTDNKYEGISKLTTQFDFLENEYDRHIVIGYDGSGNLIAIDTEDHDQIVWLDHEDYFSSRFMNSSINKLMDFLIIYRDFVKATSTENGEAGYYDTDFTDEEFQLLKERMMESDPGVCVFFLA